MKKFILFIFLLALPLIASAQIRFGYLSYNTVLTSMTDYQLAKRSIDDLKLKYDAEMKRSEKEFNEKYEEFLEVQRDLVPSPVKKKLNEAVANVARERGYAFVINTDNDACPYVNPEMGEDATEAVKAAIK